MSPIEIISLCIAGIAAIGTACAAFVAWITYKRSKRPDVILYLEKPEDSVAIWLYIKNIGNGVAYNINFDVGNLPVNIGETFFKDFSDFGIKVLGPGSYRKYPVFSSLAKSDNDSVDNSTNKDDKTIYDAKVSYDEKTHRLKKVKIKTYNESFPLDYYSFSKIVYTDTEEVKARRALEKIAKNTSK